MLVVGGKKKKGKNKKANTDVIVQEAFNIDIYTINKFGQNNSIMTRWSIEMR